jgi:hypothetical protein
MARATAWVDAQSPPNVSELRGHPGGDARYLDRSLLERLDVRRRERGIAPGALHFAPEELRDRAAAGEHFARVATDEACAVAGRDVCIHERGIASRGTCEPREDELFQLG